MRHSGIILFIITFALLPLVACCAENGSWVTKDHNVTGGGWDWLYVNTDAQITAVDDRGEASFLATGIQIINTGRHELYFTCQRTHIWNSRSRPARP